MNRMDVKEANVLMRHGSEDERSGTEAAWGQRLTNIGTGALPQGRWPRDQMSGVS